MSFRPGHGVNSKRVATSPLVSRCVMVSTVMCCGALVCCVSCRAGLGILGSGLAALRGGAKLASTLAQRHLLVTLEVTSKDKAYP